MHKNAATPKHWFVFRLGRLGDVALCTGVLERLSRDFNWTFTVVVKQAFAPLFANSPCVTRVISPLPHDLSGPGWPRFCKKLANEQRGSGLLDLHGTLRSRVLSFFWRGPVARYPKMGMERRLFLASGGRFFGAALRRHTVPQRYYMATGCTPPPQEALLPVVHLTQAESAAAQARIDGLFKPGARPLALHPFAAHPLKTWSPGRWRELAALLDERNIPWIAVGNDVSPSPFSGDLRDLCNATSLRESCALLSMCSALLSGDSGPMHLASAVGTPVIALFGPTTREWGFYPSGPRDAVVELDMPCRPCSLHGKAACPQNGRCLDALSPALILERNILPLL